MLYKTRLVRNLFNGNSFSLEVEPGRLDQFARATKLVLTAEVPKGHNCTERIFLWEFTFFESYNEVIKIRFKDGYSDDLMRQILTDFEVPRDFAEKLIADTDFINSVRGWFVGITCERERAARTLQAVYLTVKKYFRVTD